MLISMWLLRLLREIYLVRSYAVPITIRYRVCQEGRDSMRSSKSVKTDIQDTVYMVENIVCDTAKETVLDKVRKLILRDAEDLAKTQAG